MQKHSLPILKKYPLFPGKIQKLKKAPSSYDLLHFITCHQIYVRILKSRLPFSKDSSLIWVEEKEVKKINPSSLLQKILRQESPSIS